LGEKTKIKRNKAKWGQWRKKGEKPVDPPTILPLPVRREAAKREIKGQTVS